MGPMGPHCCAAGQPLRAGYTGPPTAWVSNLGCVCVWGGNTSGVRVGATTRPPPAGTRRLCVIATQGHCVIATQGPRVCWLGPEPQGTPNHTFLSPNGSPWHHLGPGDRDRAQNFGANLARGGGPAPSISTLFSPFWRPKMPKCDFL